MLLIPAALVSLLATLGPVQADGRGDWEGYFWRNVDTAVCPDFGRAAPCHFFHGKWDWKRDQWVDLAFSLLAGAVHVEVVLINRDRADDDHVCVLVLLQDGAGANLAAFHFNEHSNPQSTLAAAEAFPISADRLAAVSQLSVGTKQCREGAQQDRTTYKRVLDAIE